MSDPIINRVTNSKLEIIDLEILYPVEPQIQLDIAPWLYEGLILKEKEFRSHLKNHDWTKYKGQYIALYCSSDAIIPAWAYMLISTYLNPYAIKMVVGSLKDLEQSIFHAIITDFKTDTFINKPVLIKGCAKIKIPETAFIQLISKLQPVVKSLFFGEACSTVPLFKRPNS